MSESYRHITVLLQEAVNALQIRADGRYVDGTFGRGGHSRLVLNAMTPDAGLMTPDARLLGIDKDPDAEAAARQLASEDSRFIFQRGSFAELKQHLGQVGWSRVDGVLLDLGVSSPQLDDASRGFSFQQDGPLDMRMDSEQGESAAAWLAVTPEGEMADVFWRYGEERYSRRIAKAICSARVEGAIETTHQLAEIVSTAHPRWEKHKHPATRVFQAIRIHINKELEDLEAGLEQAFDALAVGGRLVVISFHSLEDRMVKQFMRGKVKGPDVPKWVPVQPEDLSVAKLIGKKSKASKEEIDQNPRARSAVMRVLERTGETGAGGENA